MSCESKDLNGLKVNLINGNTHNLANQLTISEALIVAADVFVILFGVSVLAL